MVFPFFVTAGICTLMQTLQLAAVELTDFLPREEKVQVGMLPNGIKTYIQENALPAKSASFRVVWKKSPHEQALCSLDTQLDSLEAIEEFFSFCASNNLESLPELNENCGFHTSLNQIKENFSPQDMAVIAVGDFPTSRIQELISNFFGQLTFSDKKQDLFAPIEIGTREAVGGVAIQIGYQAPPTSLATYEDLKEEWKHVFLQELFQQRMERCSRALREAWIHPHPRFVYPVPGYTIASEESHPNILSYLLWEIEQIKKEGFFPEEFIEIKRKAYSHLQLLSSSHNFPDHALLASYYADQFNRGVECVNYECFVKASQDLVDGLFLSELKEDVSEFLADQHRSIQIMYPNSAQGEVLSVQDVEKMIDKVSSLSQFQHEAHFPWDGVMLLNNPIGATVVEPASLEASKQNPIEEDLESSIEFSSAENTEPSFQFAGNESSGNDQSFFQLPLSDSEMRTIKSIITTMSEKNIFELALKKRELEKKGKKINQVHPMRFIGYILSSDELRKCLHIVKKSSFKWDAFIGGFAKRMKEEYSNQNVMEYIPGFSKMLNANPDRVAQYIQKKDWEGLVRFLM